MIALEKFLECVQKNADRVSEYRLGGDGADGTCDCIGLIIGAVQLAGGTWDGPHWSNYAARYKVLDLHRVMMAEQLSRGDIVFKARHRDNISIEDFYHVGVVTCVNPLMITHCACNGIKTDTELGGWAYAGKLEDIYDTFE